jgi:hypothetical protein
MTPTLIQNSVVMVYSNNDTTLLASFLQQPKVIDVDYVVESEVLIPAIDVPRLLCPRLP